MQADWVSSFIEALHGLEDRRDVEPLVAQFAPDGALWNLAHPEPVHGTEQIRKFWTAYRDEFEQIHSNFERTIVSQDETALEWRAEGRLRGGREISYRGVTILRRGDSGVTEFASYYDPRPFLKDLEQSTTQQPAHASGSSGSSGPPDASDFSEEESLEEAPSTLSYY